MTRILRKLTKLIYYTVEPRSKQVKEIDRHTARLICLMSLVLVIVGGIDTIYLYPGVSITTEYPVAEWSGFWLCIGLVIIFVISYILSRTKYFCVSPILFVAASIVIVISATITSPNAILVNSIMSNYALPIVLAGIFFPSRYVFCVVILFVIVEFSCAVFWDGSNIKLIDAMLLAPVQIMVGLFVAIASWHKNTIKILSEKTVLNSARLERHKLAEEIHDDALQDIVTAKRYIEVVKTRLSHTNPDAKAEEYIEIAGLAIDRANTRLRNLLKEARFGQAISESLENMIRDWLGIIRLWSDENDMSLSLDFDNAVDGYLDNPAAKLAVYYIIQESTSNALRHARANSLQIVAKVDVDDTLIITIMDDGNGFDGTTNIGGGIFNMKRRADEVGGQLTISKGNPNGTIVSLRVNNGGCLAQK